MKNSTPFSFKWKQALLLLIAWCYSIAALAQQAQNLRGKVYGESAAGLPGVTVLIKGTNTGTATDAEGNFNLSVPIGSSTLVVSFIGYQTQEVPINNRTTIDITLAPDAKSLNEVVVVGYGTQRKENLTGAVSTIQSEDIESRPVSNVALALQGLAPGLSVTRSTGQPGSEDIGIQIRGGYFCQRQR